MRMRNKSWSDDQVVTRRGRTPIRPILRPPSGSWDEVTQLGGGGAALTAGYRLESLRDDRDADCEESTALTAVYRRVPLRGPFLGSIRLQVENRAV